jgi:hypothetical protein
MRDIETNMNASKSTRDNTRNSTTSSENNTLIKQFVEENFDLNCSADKNGDKSSKINKNENNCSDNSDEDRYKNIFIPNSEQIKDISGHITATSVLNTIPQTATVKRLKNWRKTKKKEWRWRFFEFKDKKTVEISYIKRFSDDRIYYNRFGKWVNRDVPTIYDEYVVKTFYYYT